MYRSLMALLERVDDTSACNTGAQRPSALGDPPETLVRAVDNQLVFLFTGEELGCSSGLPSWPQYLAGLIRRLHYNRLITRDEADQLQEAVTNCRYDRVAQAIRIAVEQGEGHAITYAAEVYSSKALPSRIHEALARIRFCGAVSSALDAVLEQTAGWEKLGPDDGLTAQDRIVECLPFLLKLRGSAHDECVRLWPDSAIADIPEHCAEALRELMRTRTMLALGISPAELGRWLDTAGVSRAGHTHYLICRSSAKEVRRKAERLYGKFNIQVLVAPELDGPELLSFLRRLAAHD